MVHPSLGFTLSPPTSITIFMLAAKRTRSFVLAGKFLAQSCGSARNESRRTSIIHALGPFGLLIVSLSSVQCERFQL